VADFAVLREKFAVSQQRFQDRFIAMQKKAQIRVTPAGERAASQNCGSA
jgi:hypothetical protein